MTQRPDLFGAIWCGYPLLDMLRYQRFRDGRTWTTEYGSAENVRRPHSVYLEVLAVSKCEGWDEVSCDLLFLRAMADTRVDPMNARKMTPLMQVASSSGRPIFAALQS